MLNIHGHLSVSLSRTCTRVFANYLLQCTHFLPIMRGSLCYSLVIIPTMGVVAVSVLRHFISHENALINKTEIQESTTLDKRLLDKKYSISGLCMPLIECLECAYLHGNRRHMDFVFNPITYEL